MRVAAAHKPAGDVFINFPRDLTTGRAKAAIHAVKWAQKNHPCQ